MISVNKKYDLRHWKHGHILNQREMQIKGLRKTVLEECLTEAVFDMQNFIRNLSARVSSWPFFKLSDRAQLIKSGGGEGGGQILLDPGLREMASSLWCLLCVPENRQHLLVPETQDPDLLPPKAGAWTFPFWINERWQGQIEGGRLLYCSLMNESPNEKTIPQEKVTPRVPLNSKFWFSVLNYTPRPTGIMETAWFTFTKWFTPRGIRVSSVSINPDPVQNKPLLR